MLHLRAFLYAYKYIVRFVPFLTVVGIPIAIYLNIFHSYVSLICSPMQ